MPEVRRLSPRSFRLLARRFAASDGQVERIEAHLRRFENVFFALLGATHRVDWLSWRITQETALMLLDELRRDASLLNKVRDASHLHALLLTCSHKLDGTRTLKALQRRTLTAIKRRFKACDLPMPQVADRVRSFARDAVARFKHPENLLTSEQVLWRLERRIAIEAAMQFEAESPGDARFGDVRAQAKQEIFERDDFLSLFATRLGRF